MIEVQWEPVECIHHNGYITGYLVQCEAQESGDKQIRNTTELSAIIKNLMSFTTYSIEVAAVNSVGTGEFCTAIMAVPKPSEYNGGLVKHIYVLYMSFNFLPVFIFT